MIPRWLRLLEQLCLGPDDREHVGGDLREDYTRERAAAPARAAWRYARDLVSTASRRPARLRVAQDVSYAARRLRRAPAFSIAAILTLGVGMGATLAIYSVADAVLLTAPPYPSPDRLLFISSSFPGSTGGGDQISIPDIEEIALRARTLSRVTPMHTGRALHFGQPGAEPERVIANLVGPAYLDLLGARAALGRLIDARDHRAPGAHPVVVLSHRFWADRLGADPAAIGRVLRFSDVQLTVVGVLEPAFRDIRPEDVTADSDIFVPVMMVPAFGGADLLTSRPGRNFWAFARVADGVPVDAAVAEVAAIGEALQREHAANRGFTFWAEPVDSYLSRDIRAPLLLLLAGSAFVLLLAVANVAHLFLARVSSRVTELSVRRALGAGGAQVVSLVTAEALLLSLCGAAAGLAIARAGHAAFASVVPAELAPRLEAAALGASSLLMAAALAAGAGVLLGAICGALALRASRASLRPDTRGGIGAGGAFTRRVLVVCEVAVALVLLSQAHLMIASLGQLRGDDLGFSADRLLTVQMDLRGRRYEDAAVVTTFGTELTRELEALPGVESALLWGPARPGRNTWVTFPGREDTPEGAERLMTWRHTVTPGALAKIGTPLLRGRDIAASDTGDSTPVVVVSATLAGILWPGEDPIGKRMKWRTDLPDSPLLTVIGVAADARHRGRLASLEHADRDVYVPHAQRADRQIVAVIRASGDPAALTAPVRAVVRGLDPALPVYNVSPMSAWLAEEETETRFAATLMTAYSAAALGLAAIGIYGVLSYSVAMRRRELALRVALGAERAALLRSVLASGLRPVLAGIAAGVGLALLATRLMESLLYGVDPRDPRALGVVAALLLGVAGAAAIVPARRATSVDPMLTLRE